MVEFSPMTQALMMNNRQYLLGERPSFAQNMQAVREAESANRLRQAQSDRYNAITQDEQRKRAVLSQLDPNDPNAIPILLKHGLLDEAANLQKMQAEKARMEMFNGEISLDPQEMAMQGIRLKDPTLIQGAGVLADMNETQRAQARELLAAQEIQEIINGGKLPAQKSVPDVTNVRLNEQGLPYSPMGAQPIEQPTEQLAPIDGMESAPADDIQARIDAKMQKRQQLAPFANTERGKAEIAQIDKELSMLEKQIPSPLERLNIEEAKTQKAKGSKIANEGLYYANKLLNNLEGVKRAAGSIGGYLPNVSSNAADAAADIRALGNVLTVENLGLMSGVLSESDIALLRDVAAGGITPTRSDARLIEEIKRIKQTLEKAAVTGGDASTIQENSMAGLRTEAMQAIAKGANEQAVAQRFKQLTGEDL